MLKIPFSTKKRESRAAYLLKVAVFSGCKPSDLKRIASVTTEHRVEQGRTLTRTGELGLEFFVVIDGTAAVRRGDAVLTRLGPGSFFGELALLDGGPRTATVVAETDMRLLVSSKQEFTSLSHIAPAVTRSITAELGSRMRSTLESVDATPAERGSGPSDDVSHLDVSHAQPIECEDADGGSSFRVSASGLSLDDLKSLADFVIDFWGSRVGNPCEDGTDPWLV